MCRAVSKIFSAFLLSWYLFTVAGFDVHRSCECGRAFVEPLFTGISCERIHPDVECTGGHEGHCDDEEECCTDSIFQITLTGVESPAAFSFDCFLLSALTFNDFYIAEPAREHFRVFSSCGYPPWCSPSSLIASSIMKA